jgi:hypothetical protein
MWAVALSAGIGVALVVGVALLIAAATSSSSPAPTRSGTTPTAEGTSISATVTMPAKQPTTPKATDRAMRDIYFSAEVDSLDIRSTGYEGSEIAIEFNYSLAKHDHDYALNWLIAG